MIQQLVVRKHKVCNPTIYVFHTAQVLKGSLTHVAGPVVESETDFVTYPHQFIEPTPCSLSVVSAPAGREDEQERSGKDSDVKAKPPTRRDTLRWMYRNVIGVGLSFFFVFSAFLGLQNLQSSQSPKVGLVSLVILYVFFALSGFITPGLIKLVGTKYILLVGFVCHLIYTLGYFYLNWYTLVHTSILLGLASGPIWAGASAHLVNVAIVSAPRLERDQDNLISSFMGIFFFFFEWAQIPGNLASSLIFFSYRSSHTSLNSSVLDSCEQTEVAGVDTTYLYILVSVYCTLISLGIACLLCMVDHLPRDREKCSSVLKTMKLYFGDPVIELLNVMKDWRMILVTPIAIVNGMEQSFVFSTFTEIISECFGIYLVGFSIILFGVTSALLSLAYGQVVRCIPRFTIFLFGGIINVCLLLFLLLWTPTPSYIAISMFVICWGAADAVWNTMTASLVGIMFPTQLEVAYSVCRIWLAIGSILGFSCTRAFHRDIRYLIMMVAVIIAVFSNLLLEFKTRPIETLRSDFVSSKYSLSSSKQESLCQKGSDYAIQTIEPLSLL